MPERDRQLAQLIDQGINPVTAAVELGLEGDQVELQDVLARQEDIRKLWEIQNVMLEEMPRLRAISGPPKCGKTTLASQDDETYFNKLKAHGIEIGGEYNNYFIFCNNLEEQIRRGKGNYKFLTEDPEHFDPENFVIKHDIYVYDPQSQQDFDNMMDIMNENNHKTSYIRVCDGGGTVIMPKTSNQSSSPLVLLSKQVRWYNAHICIDAHSFGDFPFDYRKACDLIDIFIPTNTKETKMIREDLFLGTQKQFDQWFSTAFSTPHTACRVNGKIEHLHPRMVFEKNPYTRRFSYLYYNTKYGFTEYKIDNTPIV